MSMSHAISLSEASGRKSASDALLSLNSMALAISHVFSGKRNGNSEFKKLASELNQACKRAAATTVKDQKTSLDRLRQRMGGKR